MNDFYESVNYPFKSKYKYIKDTHIKTEPYVPDHKLKIAKKLSKPDFSLTPHCWEMDLMFANSTIYLVMININTKYLIVIPIDDKTEKSIIKAIDEILNNTRIEIETIKCDGEKAFTSNSFKKYCNGEKLFESTKTQNKRYARYDKVIKVLQSPNKIKLVINDSPFALAHKCVDAVIRTIRDAFGLSNERIANPQLMKQMVDWYNNTPHSSLRLLNPNYELFDGEADKYYSMAQPKYIYLTPNQMQHNRDLEWQFIRMKKLELHEIQRKQLMKGLLTYRRGNIIIVHTDYGKTEKKHEKKRRVFNELAEFIGYDNGNVKCLLLKPKRKITHTKDNRAIITVPVMYTKYVCSSIDALNDEYKEFFLLKNNESETTND